MAENENEGDAINAAELFPLAHARLDRAHDKKHGFLLIVVKPVDDGQAQIDSLGSQFNPRWLAEFLRDFAKRLEAGEVKMSGR